MAPYASLCSEIPVLLAPMSGVTDQPFRKQVLKFGARVVITEMVAGEDLTRGHREAETRLLKPEGHDGSHVVQLVGREEEPLRQAACIAAQSGADVIDINMGCPSRRVTGGLSGSALMRDLDRAERLISAVLDGAGDVPVTLKMRLGWDRESICAPSLSQKAEALGVQLVTVHGRTRQDFYDGHADWRQIADVKSAVSIPVIANGDIVDATSARRAMNESMADGVMIGRAATGRAWLIAKTEAELNGRIFEMPTFEEEVQSLLEQTRDSIAVYGERNGMRVIRKHLSAAYDDWLVRGKVSDSYRTDKASLCQCTTLGELETNLNRLVGISLEMAA